MRILIGQKCDRLLHEAIWCQLMYLLLTDMQTIFTFIFLLLALSFSAQGSNGQYNEENEYDNQNTSNDLMRYIIESPDTSSTISSTAPWYLYSPTSTSCSTTVTITQTISVSKRRHHHHHHRHPRRHHHHHYQNDQTITQSANCCTE
jgi:hypothetical protein